MANDTERLLRTPWTDLTADEREVVREAERRVGHLTWNLGDTPEKACARKLAPAVAELTAARERIKALEGALARRLKIVEYADDRGSDGGYRVEIRIGGARLVDQDRGLFDTREKAEKRRQSIIRKITPEDTDHE